jgi:deazaflavin-dependent oxidoreductase (nitroreductase family)
VANWQWFGKLHTSAYRATGGILGGNLAGLPMLLLTTTGRKSGQPRTTPMPYFEDDGRWVLVGSNNGGPRDPLWWLNLQADERAEIQVRRATTRVRAALAAPEERARLWPLLLAFNSPYAKYEKRTTREIPVVILSRAE